MVEVLSRCLNSLFENRNFKVYGLPKWSLKINRLAYADDTILFCSGDKYLVIQVMTVIRKYENKSGQLVNKTKSFYYLYDRNSLTVAIRLNRLTGNRQSSFLFTYLGCPVFIKGRKNITLKTLPGKWPEGSYHSIISCYLLEVR